jgi:hypothetical protein
MGDTGQDTGMADQLNDKLMMNRERTRNERIEDRICTVQQPCTALRNDRDYVIVI